VAQGLTEVEAWNLMWATLGAVVGRGGKAVLSAKDLARVINAALSTTHPAQADEGDK
jgi:hypothetical protein